MSLIYDIMSEFRWCSRFIPSNCHYLTQVIRNKLSLFPNSIQYYQHFKGSFIKFKVPWNIVLIFLHWQNYTTVMAKAEINPLIFKNLPHNTGNVIVVIWSFHVNCLLNASRIPQLLEFNLCLHFPKGQSMLTCINQYMLFITTDSISVSITDQCHPNTCSPRIQAEKGKCWHSIHNSPLYKII